MARLIDVLNKEEGEVKHEVDRSKRLVDVLSVEEREVKGRLRVAEAKLADVGRQTLTKQDAVKNLQRQIEQLGGALDVALVKSDHKAADAHYKKTKPSGMGAQVWLVRGKSRYYVRVVSDERSVIIHDTAYGAEANTMAQKFNDLLGIDGYSFNECQTLNDIGRVKP